MAADSRAASVTMSDDAATSCLVELSDEGTFLQGLVCIVPAPSSVHFVCACSGIFDLSSLRISVADASGKISTIQGKLSVLDGSWFGCSPFLPAGHFSVQVSDGTHSAPQQFLQVLPQATPAAASLVMQTFLTKCLGPLPCWRSKLTSAAASGYNAVHLTPLCSLGASGSAYSIQDHTRYGASLQCADAQQCESDLRVLFEELRTGGCLVFSDFVPNHVASSARWLLESPDMTFNLQSAPWLTAAAILDDSIQRISNEVCLTWHPSHERLNAVFAADGLPLWNGTTPMDTPPRVRVVTDFILSTAKARCRPWEYYAMSANQASLLEELLMGPYSHQQQAATARDDAALKKAAAAIATCLLQEPQALHNPSMSGHRFPVVLSQGGPVENALAKATGAVAQALGGGIVSSSDMPKVCKHVVDMINLQLFKVWDDDAAACSEGVHGAAAHLWMGERGGAAQLQEGGGVVPAYFQRMHEGTHAWRCGVMACNGFVWGGDVMQVPTYPAAAQGCVKSAMAQAAQDDAQGGADAKTTSSVWPLECSVPLSAASGTYMRRELVAWSDCIKLNYGVAVQWKKPLWKRMRAYAESLADLFDGVRLDNCHGTPMFVSQALLRCMRQRRPQMLVIAELFTGNASLDEQFVARLGITALVREMMQCGDVAQVLSTILSSSLAGSKRPLGAPSAVMGGAGVLRCSSDLPVMLYDVTHDNEPADSRFGAWGTPVVAALASMAAGAVGTTWGVDQLLPEQLDVVKENRTIPTASVKSNPMLSLRGLLNAIHAGMYDNGLLECHAQQMPHAEHLLHVQRLNRRTGQSVHLIVALDSSMGAPTSQGGAQLRVKGATPGLAAFAHVGRGGGEHSAEQGCIPLPEIEGCCLMSETSSLFLNGDCAWGQMFEGASQVPAGAAAEAGVTVTSEGGNAIVDIDCAKFAVGSVALFMCSSARQGDVLPAHPLAGWAGSAAPATAPAAHETAQAMREACSGMDAEALRFALYMCEAEEREDSGGAHGCYSVPGVGALPWAGVAGVAPLLREFVRQDATGHAIAAHLREGDWYVHYTAQRLSRRRSCAALGRVLRGAAGGLQGLSRDAVPAATSVLLLQLWNALMSQCLSIFSSSPLLQALQAAGDMPGWCLVHPAQLQPFTWPAALQLMQHHFMLVGDSKSAPLLDGVSLGVEGKGGVLQAPLPLASMAAGVPHFSCSYMRCWGRDTFISCRGLTMLTGQWRCAAAHLLAFATVIRNGLVPNLHNAGRRPRYNARDATWFWASAVVDYVKLAPDGVTLLDVPLHHADGHTWSVRQALLSVLAAARGGVSFREDGAGESLDAHMTDEGFNVRFGPHPAPAFVHSGLVAGGNAANCGTWMDKMGSSAAWGNKGIPATPRCGAPVEITGLVFKVLTWAEQTLGDAGGVDLREWRQQLLKSAHPLYFIPTDASDDEKYLVRSTLVSQVNRGYLRDVAATAPLDSTVGGEGCMPPSWPLEFTEYQLRPNQLVALAEAPSLWPAGVASSALRCCEQHLVQRGSMGVRTLAPFDWAFRGDYVNSDSSSRETADGWNYHQGPEWLWLWGVYWRARVHTCGGARSHVLQQLWSAAAPHVKHLNSNAWGGLPELCNAGNAHCPDSCDVQAWSAATLLDALYDTLQLPLR